MVVALAGSLSVAALAPQPASADIFGDPFGFFRQPQREYVPQELPPPVRRRVISTRYDKDAKKFGKPAGPVTIVVSVAKQRVTLFADGKEVAAAPVSTGVAGHETPLGVFAVISKARYHESNLYSSAPMPYMQRITWSGIALHEGPLPGHAASHGCIRLPGSFASSLYGFTRLGARVVVTRDPVAPVEFSSPRLFVPKKPEEVPVATGSVPLTPVVLAEAQTTGSVTSNGAPSIGANPATAPDAAPAPAIDKKAETAKRKGPVSVFVSRKTGRLYVRQNFEPVFDMPVTIAEPDKPWGTHIFTAMEIKDDQVRWTALTVPSGYLPKVETGKRGKKLSARETERRARLAADLAAAPTPEVALERFEMPKDAVDRIGELLKPGSSLIVSDNGPSDETGEGTDFVVATP
ncbi:MAG: L,D-transpeptidase [Pseudolabrys sp.]|nr:L,D-transpeptidase [Pseudolabrys sp.]